MSLSHLYPHQANDLHINNAYDLPSGFPLTSICAGIVHLHSGSSSSTQTPCRSQSISFRLHFYKTKTRTTAKLPNPCYKTGALNKCITLDKFRRFALSVWEFFSSFVHTTCALSVSLHYLALDGMYHLLKAAFSSYPTRLTETLLVISNEASTLYSRTFNYSSALTKIPFNHISPRGLNRRALLSSVALTKSILVSFFSSAY